MEKRRFTTDRSDLIKTFEFIEGIMMLRKIFLELDDRDRRGHDHNLFKKGFRLDVRKFVISNRIVNDWNSLS